MKTGTRQEHNRRWSRLRKVSLSPKVGVGGCYSSRYRYSELVLHGLGFAVTVPVGMTVTITEFSAVLLSRLYSTNLYRFPLEIHGAVIDPERPPATSASLPPLTLTRTNEE